MNDTQFRAILAAIIWAAPDSKLDLSESVDYANTLIDLVLESYESMEMEGDQ